MALPLHERAHLSNEGVFVRLTSAGIDSLYEAGAAVMDSMPPMAPMASIAPVASKTKSLIPERKLAKGEQYRFHFDMTKCIGCRSCEIACNEQNGNPASINWRRIGEIEGGTWPHTQRHYLSMGCNHCLDAECLKGCPVDAYKKDPLTGIVLHSTDACIGCQYCVWNCPYSVPQFNPDRGVVGKCDMCHGRLTDGLEPACVNACPEAAIEVEIINMATWRDNYAAAESPGMPAAGHTISTTRITLPESTAVQLERVDAGRIRLEHAHMSLVFMTTLMQAVIGSLTFVLLHGTASTATLLLLLLITSVALNISVFHLGRPAYAWRAMKMWRRSWLSREVLLFGLFFGALAFFFALSLPASLPGLHSDTFPRLLYGLRLLASSKFFPFAGWSAVVLGLAGTIASAFIYLVPARPSWNMVHTPLDFLLSAALIGSLLPSILQSLGGWSLRIAHLDAFINTGSTVSFAIWPVAVAATLWLSNQVVRRLRLNFSSIFERRATASLLETGSLHPLWIASLITVAASALLAGFDHNLLACLSASAGILLSRYLFFVSVVPLNMALTFVRGGHN